MEKYQEVILKRNCKAVRIPSGETMDLPEGMSVVITQSLGGSYTLAVDVGLARVDGADADALGIEPETPEQSNLATHPQLSQTECEQAIWDALKTCFDPEIPVNVDDLGLIYDCAISESKDGLRSVEVQMTLTAPGCGMGPTIAADVQRKIMAIASVAEANVNLVWDPPWNQDMISEVGKMKLGLI